MDFLPPTFLRIFFPSSLIYFSSIHSSILPLFVYILLQAFIISFFPSLFLCQVLCHRYCHQPLSPQSPHPPPFSSPSTIHTHLHPKFLSVFPQPYIILSLTRTAHNISSFFPTHTFSTQGLTMVWYGICMVARRRPRRAHDNDAINSTTCK